jgi:hypothetical protein
MLSCQIYGYSQKIVGGHVERKGTVAPEIPKSEHCSCSANATQHACWGTEAPCHQMVYDTDENKKELILKAEFKQRACCGSM